MTAEIKPIMVVLDGYTTNPGDLSWDGLRALGDLVVYDRTPPEQVTERSRDAVFLLVNKVKLDAKTLAGLPSLKCICVLATGYNNIDIIAAKQRGIAVCNARGYSTDSVAQHVFAMILAMVNQVAEHNAGVQQGIWLERKDFSFTLTPILELSGKTLGIYGLGQIGSRVASIGQTFGMQVIAHHKHPERDAREGVRFVDLDTLFGESDFLSLHAPLTPENQSLINADRLSQMKRTAYLVNTSRGGLIDETDLRQALISSQIAGAALDVLSKEPPDPGHPLLGLKNCLITPHNAWASKESRRRLLEETIKNVAAFLGGKARNEV